MNRDIVIKDDLLNQSQIDIVFIICYNIWV
jgi:hypothetical protein